MKINMAMLMILLTLISSKKWKWVCLEQGIYLKTRHHSKSNNLSNKKRTKSREQSKSISILTKDLQRELSSQWITKQTMVISKAKSICLRQVLQSTQGRPRKSTPLLMARINRKVAMWHHSFSWLLCQFTVSSKDSLVDCNRTLQLQSILWSQLLSINLLLDVLLVLL